jgi:hypothetical protein
MPNWVDNRIVISGPATDVEALIVFMKGPDRCFDFGQLIPMPRGLVGSASPPPDVKTGKSLIAQYGYQDWYTWSVANWGTKWGACNGGPAPLTESPLEVLAAAGGPDPTREIEYTFQTAWGPPTPVVRALAARFPTCTLTWYSIEEQPSFGGLFFFAEGAETGGGFNEGSMDTIWSMSDWHEEFRWDPEENE